MKGLEIKLCQDFCKLTCGICDKAVPEELATDVGPAEVTSMRSYFVLQAFCCTAGDTRKTLSFGPYYRACLYCNELIIIYTIYNII